MDGVPDGVTSATTCVGESRCGNVRRWAWDGGCFGLVGSCGSFRGATEDWARLGGGGLISRTFLRALLLAKDELCAFGLDADAAARWEGGAFPGGADGGRIGVATGGAMRGCEGYRCCCVQHAWYWLILLEGHPDTKAVSRWHRDISSWRLKA